LQYEYGLKAERVRPSMVNGESRIPELDDTTILVEFYEIVVLLKIEKDLRKEWLKPVGQCGIGTVSNTHPDHRGFLRGGEQDQVFRILILGHDDLSMSDGMVPNCLIVASSRPASST
jgi:hypothetical protein